MSLSAALPALTGLAGLFMQGQQNSAAQSAANQAAAEQNAIVKRQSDAMDAIMGRYNQNKQAGYYDANTQWQPYKALIEHQNTVGMNNAAGAAKTLGYRPGDTAPIDQINQLGTEGALKEATAQQGFTQALHQQEGQDLGQVTQAGAAMSPDMYGLGMQQSNYLHQMVDPAGMLEKLTPYLQKAITPFSVPGTTGNTNAYVPQNTIIPPANGINGQGPTLGQFPLQYLSPFGNGQNTGQLKA
jgi:hypothetical protein